MYTNINHTTACGRSTQQRLGGQTSLPCGDEHGARWRSQTMKRGSRLAKRRLHGSLIAEEAMSARNATTAAALIHRRRTTAPRVIHMGPPPPPRPTIVAKGVVGTRQRTQEVRAEHRRGKNNIPIRNIIFPDTILNTYFRGRIPFGQ